MTEIDAIAREMITTKRGIGMIPPFYAETASTKGNVTWPFWIVRNKTCSSLGTFMPRGRAEELAAAMNRACDEERRQT